MRRVDWHEDALNDLVVHDAWRVSRGWESMATEIMDQVTAIFAKGDVYPKHQCRVRGELLPVYRTWLIVRSKKFVVYFLDSEPGPVIRRVLHPRRDRNQVEQ